jgi:hypothetical protein
MDDRANARVATALRSVVLGLVTKVHVASSPDAAAARVVLFALTKRDRTTPWKQIFD